MSVAIRTEHLSKEYRLGVINHGMLYKDMQSWLSRKLGRPDPHSHSGNERFFDQADRFWALKDLSFDIERGERVGVIGKNGAGKSTLLKILSRITAPTEGVVKIKGRIASLLEVGTGFHPELTGRENIYLNGAILGMKTREIDRKLDEIVEFSEIGQFIDTPVKRYSSGMYVRLAFSVAAHLDSEILVSDEVLSVGDAAFQKKALGKMSDLGSEEGKTVLFVSHNMAAVQSLCTSGMVLQRGEMVFKGDVRGCVAYYANGGSPDASVVADLSTIARMARYCTGEARITAFSIHNENSESKVINSDAPVIAEITFEVFYENTNVGAEIIISDDFNKLSFFDSYRRNGLVPFLSKGMHKIICRLDSLPLLSGQYHVTIGLSRPGIHIDLLENVFTIDVELPFRAGMFEEYQKAFGKGCTYIEHEWTLAR